jgi:hypothetical protein
MKHPAVPRTTSRALADAPADPSASRRKRVEFEGSREVAALDSSLPPRDDQVSGRASALLGVPGTA